MINKIIPNSIKVIIRQIQRERIDKKTGVKSQFAKQENLTLKKSFSEIISVSQPIHYNPLSGNKVENIKIAIKKIEPIVIQPNQVFSFWELVKKPSKKDGYKSGRNIIGDKLQEDIGGGLCQVSGILYHLALLSGMEIIERHNHTIDLYKEDERYTPIGTDATVVFGYKDIRFKNTSNQSISFSFDVNESKFSATLLAEKKLPEYKLRFVREEFKDYRTVKTYRINSDNEESYINLSRYKL